MDRKIVIAPEAEEEIASAYFWYEGQDSGLGERFLRVLKSTLSSVTSNPDFYPRRFDAVHRVTLKKFPYSVYYEYDDDSVFLLSVFHEARNPSYLARLKNP